MWPKLNGSSVRMEDKRSGSGSALGEVKLQFPRSEGKPMAREGSDQPTGAERRQHPRFPCMLETRFRRVGRDGSIDADEDFIKCKTVNISDGGLLLEGDAYVSEGQRLEVFVKLKDESKTVAGEAVAVRSEKKFGKFRIGVKFLKKETF